MTHNASQECARTREVFSVEGARVTLDTRHGWLCTCAASRPDFGCAHIEQAQVLRGRRREKREADTVELELGAAELRLLSEGLAGEMDEPSPREPISKANHRWDWTMLLATAGMAALSSGITYLAVKQPEPVRAEQQALSASHIALQPQPAPATDADVTFVNPFDATETFQFPPGTSLNHAREAVAELLLKRAEERLEATDELRRQFSNTGERTEPAGLLAQGS
jgi:hypothetical protein